MYVLHRNRNIWYDYEVHTCMTPPVDVQCCYTLIFNVYLGLPHAWVLHGMFNVSQMHTYVLRNINSLHYCV